MVLKYLLHTRRPTVTEISAAVWVLKYFITSHPEKLKLRQQTVGYISPKEERSEQPQKTPNKTFI